MATTAIEAKSLSSITSLAANPPWRPQNVQIDPLVLYIARVPGSRDVILSPMKPRQRNITAEDIDSCLYYFHVSSPEDEALLKEPLPVIDVQKGHDEEEVPPPLPTRNSPPLPARPSPAPSPPRLHVPNALRPGITVVNPYQGDATTYGVAANPHPLPQLPPYPLDDGPPKVPMHGQKLAASLVARKPVMPPRKPIAASSSRPRVESPVRKPLRYDFEQSAGPSPSSEYSRSWDDSPLNMEDVLPELPRRRATNELIQESDSSTPARPFLTQRPTMGSFVEAGDAPEVTVIRRNPANGEQWNIATISDPPVYDTTSSGRTGSATSSRIRKAGQPLYLRLTSPGYRKFVSSQSLSGSASMISTAPSLSQSDGQTEDSSIETSPTFDRRMWMEGSHFEKANSHRKSLSADHAGETYVSTRPTFSTSHSNDSSLLSSGPYEREGSSEFLDPPDVGRLKLVGDHKRSNTKGYTFISPWDGRCEFASSTMGNALKCRHLRQKNSLNPGGSVPTQVSELRFNLPGGGPMSEGPRRRSPPKYGQKERKRDRFMAKFSDRRSSYDEEVHLSGDGGDKLDMRLGQEMAGGGFSGREAKLGKLIVEGEGLQMLDLVVTANMALWFRAYQRHQEGR